MKCKICDENMVLENEKEIKLLNSNYKNIKQQEYTCSCCYDTTCDLMQWDINDCHNNNELWKYNGLYILDDKDIKYYRNLNKKTKNKRRMKKYIIGVLIALVSIWLSEFINYRYVIAFLSGGMGTLYCEVEEVL